MVSTEFVAISPYLTVYTVDKKNIKDFVRKMLVSTDTMYKMVPSFFPWHQLTIISYIKNSQTALEFDDDGHGHFQFSM